MTVGLRISSVCVGICFGCCNVLNTYLAGNLSSAFFFPVQNISVILISLIVGMIFFSERLGKKGIAVLLLGTAAILLLK